LSEAAYLRVEALVKRFTPAAAVDGVSFSVPTGKLFTLLGPSGCGKSTTLRCIAGLERPEAGTIAIDGKVVFSSDKNCFVPPDKRGIGMVFQSYAIWPHMTVYENVAYALEVKRTPRAEVRERVMEALERVGLAALAERPAPQLSGGQQQRVALARAVVGRPSLLLFDEPLSNLDAKLRERMREEIRELQQRLKITAVYVTHDQAEALALSDSIAVMEAGRIVALGSPREVYGAPATRFVADFVGSANIVRGRVLPGARADGTAEVETACGMLRCRLQDGARSGDTVEVLIRPESVALLTTAPQASENVWPAAVERILFLGEYQDATVRLRGHTLRVRVPPWIELSAGQPVYLEMAALRCSAIRAE
jgi:iron(III) transport system ATP-binding protein